MTKNSIPSKINLNQLDRFLKLIEIQHEVAYELHEFHEGQKKAKERLERILMKAQKLAQLTQEFRTVEKQLRRVLSDEEIIELNRLLISRHIPARISR